MNVRFYVSYETGITLYDVKKDQTQLNALTSLPIYYSPALIDRCIALHVSNNIYP